MDWMKDLTKKEKKHLLEDAGCKTLEQFKRNADHQKKMREKTPGIEPCWDCKFIAKKLGLPV